jgi:hypothetical protein
MAEGKVLPGDDFNPPPAAIWNNMVDAGRAWADGRFSSQSPNPIRPRETDIIKAKNTSGAARRLGEVLRISGKAIETVTDENKWLLGVELTDDGYFGILKEPVENNGLASLQVSGCCMALVNVTDADHKRAMPADGEYVLQSGSSGPIELMFAPSGTGEKTCLVKFDSGYKEHAVILDADLPAASHALTGATSCFATVCEWNSADEEYAETAKQITVWNHAEATAHVEDTFGIARWIDGHWHFFGDCEPMAAR